MTTNVLFAIISQWRDLMSAATYNLSIDQGTTFALDLTVKEAGVVKDLTGYQARAQLRRTKSAATAAASFTCSVLIPASQGKVKKELSASQSDSIDSGLYFYDLEIFTASDVIVKRLIEGQIVLSQSITRD